MHSLPSVVGMVVLTYMTYPVPDTLMLPIEPYEISGYKFRQVLRRRLLLWAWHLGDDVVTEPGVPVRAIGAGEVLWSAVRKGSPEHRNWGGLVVIGHTHVRTGAPFFSLYGHLTDLRVKVGEHVAGGQELGVVAAGNTPENGWWQKPHLHFALYTGPWDNQVLPGYKRIEERRTKLSWWEDPLPFLQQYGLAEAGASHDT